MEIVYNYLQSTTDLLRTQVCPVAFQFNQSLSLFAIILIILHQQFLEEKEITIGKQSPDPTIKFDSYIKLYFKTLQLGFCLACL